MKGSTVGELWTGSDPTEWPDVVWPSCTVHPHVRLQSKYPDMFYCSACRSVYFNGRRYRVKPPKDGRREPFLCPTCGRRALDVYTRELEGSPTLTEVACSDCGASTMWVKTSLIPGHLPYAGRKELGT